MNYKKGINSLENRKLRRTRLDEQRDQSRTRRISQRRRSGENDGLCGNLNASAKGNTKIEQCKPRVEKKVYYAGSARDKLTQFYSDHNPTRLVEIDAKLKQYANNEDELFAKLAKKYSVDPSVFGPRKPFFTTTSMYSGIAKKSSPTNVLNSDTPINSNGGTFAAYAASPGMVSFGSLATPKKGSSIFGVIGSMNNKPSIFGDNTFKSSNKGRTTITSLRTYSGGGFRGLGNGDDDDDVCDSDDMMECD